MATRILHGIDIFERPIPVKFDEIPPIVLGVLKELTDGRTDGHPIITIAHFEAMAQVS